MWWDKDEKSQSLFPLTDKEQALYLLHKLF